VVGEDPPECDAAEEVDPEVAVLLDELHGTRTANGRVGSCCTAHLKAALPAPVKPASAADIEQKRKAFFFEKKKQKTFVRFGCGIPGEARPSS
jgi:hypothetical protein